MPSYRTTSAQSLWLTLLAAFFLQAADAIAFKRVDSRALYGEQASKTCFPEPVDLDGPSSTIAEHGRQLARRIGNHASVADALPARGKDVHGSHIRAPPGNRHAPA